MGRLTLAAVAAALLLGGTACGERSEPTGADAHLYPVTVQTGDRPVVVNAPAKRIAALDKPAQDTIRALGLGPRLVLGAPADKIDFAALKRAKPDLVVASQEADERDLSRAGSVTDALVYQAPGDSLQQVERAITQLGLLTGTPVKARALVRHIERRRAAVAGALGRMPNVTVFVDTGLFTTVSDQSLIGDVLREAHAKNVAGAAAESGPLDIADVIELDPDVYMTTSDTQLTLADMRRDPRTRKLRAIREGRFVVVDVAQLEPGPAIGEGLADIARLLHPDAFR